MQNFKISLIVSNAFKETYWGEISCIFLQSYDFSDVCKFCTTEDRNFRFSGNVQFLVHCSAHTKEHLTWPRVNLEKIPWGHTRWHQFENQLGICDVAAAELILTDFEAHGWIRTRHLVYNETRNMTVVVSMTLRQVEHRLQVNPSL